MTELIKIAVIALVGTLLILTLKKTNSDIALLLTIATGIVILISLLGTITTVLDAIQTILDRFSIPSRLFTPMLKAAGISVITKITAELCRQSGESALAVKVELAGTMTGILVTLPLLTEVMDFIGKLMVGT